jgi:peptide chain release factor subunit 1
LTEDPVPDFDRDFLRSLSEWTPQGVPVGTLYLDVDGRRYPRKQDLQPRLEDLIRRLREQGDRLDRDARRSVDGDVERFREFIGGLDRAGTRGVALFSASGAGLWQDVALSRPLPDRARLGPRPYVLPLEALMETYETFCTCLVDRARARIFLARMGTIREQDVVLDDVPGQHDQGGWSQARYARHIEEHVGQHLKRVGDLLLRVLEGRGFDHLILGGPDELLPEFERGLHDYLRRRVAARITLPVTAAVDEVLERSLAVEEQLELQSERQTVQRLIASAGAGRGGVIGLPDVLNALNESRVETLVVPFGQFADGVRCTNCGGLAVSGPSCPVCGKPTEPVPDIVEEAVAKALGQGTRVETLTVLNADRANGFHDVGALLRF